MYQQGDTRPVMWSDRLLLWVLTLLLLFTPLAFGAVEVWSIALAELLALFMGAIWTARMICDGRIQYCFESPPHLHSPLSQYSPGAEDTRGEGDDNGRACVHRQAGAWDSNSRTANGTDKHRIDAIIARLAQPEPLPNLSALCPDRRELIIILLDIRKGLRSSCYAELRGAAELKHLDVRHLVQKAETLLVSMHLASSADYYAILDVKQNASAEAIHEKWIDKMRIYHPDNYEDPTGWITEQSRSLNEAYAVLKDPEKRREYNARRKVRMKGGLRTAGATDFLTPDRATRSASASSAQSRLTRVAPIVAIVIASLIVALLLWSL